MIAWDRPRLAKRAALARPILALACALALSGCISLLPKTQPARLYRFDYTAASGAAAPAPASGPRAGVYLANGAFPNEAASDQILTITGERAAYIADTRWVAPAAVLWEEAVRQAFEASSARVRLVARGEPARSQYALRLSVLKFEADYDAGRPIVLVRVRASLIGSQTRDVVSEQTFEARTPAEADRVSAIVAAFDQAVGQVLNGIVGWTDAQVRT